MGQTSISPAVIIPESASSHHHYIPLPLILASPPPRSSVECVAYLAQTLRPSLRCWTMTAIPWSECGYFGHLLMLVSSHESIISWLPGGSLDIQIYASLLPMCSSDSRSSVIIRVITLTGIVAPLPARLLAWESKNNWMMAGITLYLVEFFMVPW